MGEPITDKILLKIDQASILYYRLVILVGASGTGKTSALQKVQEYKAVPMININLELSRRLLELTERQRILLLPRILSKIITESSKELVLLDNIEVLFDVSLKQDPLRLLQGISRNKTVVATWNGSVDDNYLLYAKPDHPEYKRYPINDFLVVNAEAA